MKHPAGSCPVQTRLLLTTLLGGAQFRPTVTTIVLPGGAQFKPALTLNHPAWSCPVPINSDTSQPAQFLLFSSDPSGKCKNNVSN